MYVRDSLAPSIWNELRHLRGIVIDGNGKILSQGMVKFLNVEELYNDEIDRIMNDNPRITEKFDGTCMMLMEYGGEQFFRTMGLFDSHQAKDANSKFLNDVAGLNTSMYTYVFEYLSPDDRKVVDYGRGTELVFICRISNYDIRRVGTLRIPHDEFLDDIPDDDTDKAILSKFKYARILDLPKSVKELKAMDLDNKEGFVVKSGSGERMKVKFENYLKKFRSKFNYTINCMRHDWTELDEDEQDDFIRSKEWDEEMRLWVEEKFHAWNDKYNEIKTEIDTLWKKYHNITDRKQFALAIKGSPYSGALFILFDNFDNSADRLDKYIKKLVLDK